ncbi:MAG: hypothetical protein MK171_06055 [Pirellulales bacterium]|nr:hypothetical protein [Pirellulales bacterium]
MPHRHLAFCLGHTARSEATVYLQAHPDEAIVCIEGRLRGPYCKWARTLPAEYVVKPHAECPSRGGLAQVLVLEPCYWTPHLPFQYELQLSLHDSRGNARELAATVGLRQWGVEGCNLLLDRRRIVLRGMSSAPLTLERIDAAREAETALLVDPPSVELCAAASRMGVPLVVDLRHLGADFIAAWRRLSWCASVLVVILTADQVNRTRAAGETGTQALIALSITANTSGTAAARVACDLYAIDLQPGERPPAWVADCPLPVFGIRHEANGFQRGSERNSCDQLQSEWAPQFDLAGYFLRLGTLL